MESLLEDLGKAAERVVEHDNKTRAKLKRLGDAIAEHMERADYGVWGEVYALEQDPEGFPEVLGRLIARRSGLALALSSGYASADQPWDIVEIDDWHTDYVRYFRDGSEVANLVKRATQRLGAAAAGETVTVPTGLEFPKPEVVASAETFGFSAVIGHWHQANRQLSLDPKKAVHEACSLVESTCKHVIDKASGTVPARHASMKQLVNEAISALGLDGLDRQCLSSIRGMAERLTEARNPVAHGAPPGGYIIISKPLAELCVTTAGALACFLMRHLKI